jgi:beta-galactosidase
MFKFTMTTLLFAGLIAQQSAAQEKFTPPASPRATYSFNADWHFMRAAQPDQDIPEFEAPAFDDSKWPLISTPHTFNDVDSFRQIISHSGGDRGMFKGLAFYRKHFKLAASANGGKVFLEFEGMRQAGQIYLNGKQVGLSENGITAHGVDLTPNLHFGDQENVRISAGSTAESGCT